MLSNVPGSGQKPGFLERIVSARPSLPYRPVQLAAPLGFNTDEVERKKAQPVAIECTIRIDRSALPPIIRKDEMPLPVDTA